MKTIWIILLSLCVGGLLSTMLMRSCQTPQIERVVIEKTDTLIVEKVDTLLIEKPVPYKVEIKDTVYLPNNEGIESGCQNKHAQGTLFVQEVKEYKDSTYYAKISGINAYLEEIRVYPKTITQYVNTTETIYIPPKKWSIGIQGGIGITPVGLQPYIGFGVTRRLEF